MLQTNPFSILAETISPLAMQGFIFAMVILIAAGTVIQMIHHKNCLLYTSPSPRDRTRSRMPSSA